MKIGNIETKNNIVLAPMAGVCNSSFRRIIKDMGAGLIYAEMVSDKAIVYGNEKTIDMLYMEEYERPLVQQIFGSDKDSFVAAAKYIEEVQKPDIIDINMGCPVPKVALKAQAGSALLKNPEKVYEIVKAVVESVSIPVTVKIRSGWDEKSINAVEIAKLCEKAGASAICVHGRTRKQAYTGKVNLDIIKEVKENVSIPVIGNGDVNSIESAKHMFEYTGCDGIMIGRASLGNPFIIKQLVEYFDTGVILEEPTYKEKLDIARLHFDNLVKDKGESLALIEMRTHLTWYFKGLKNSVSRKNAIFNCKSYDEVKIIFDEYEEELSNSM